jgi:general secretion pathway protein F
MSAGELAVGRTGSISIDELAALNEEISALVRAGVPLDRGLLRAGTDLQGKLKRITQSLGQRLSQGQSLPQALEAEHESIPPLYRAVVEAGARSGRLAVALEGLARYVRGYSEARAAIGVALWYPILVLSLAYGLFLALLVVIIPRFVAAFESLGLRVIGPLRWLETAGELSPYWWPVWPVLLLILGIAWWRSGIAATFQTSSWSVLKIFPWMRSMLSDYEAAGFAELMALLVEHGVAYPAAVKLAADSTGNAAMSREAAELAAAVEQGEPAATAVRHLAPVVFPPLLRWGLAAGKEQAPLAESMRTLAPMYRKRGAYQAEKLQIFLPTMLMLGIGGTATLFYGLTLFIPLSTMLMGISGPGP